MRELFVDTNVIIDLLLGREPYASNAINIFRYAIKNDIILNVCSFSYATSCYILRKSMSHKNVLHDLGWLLELSKCLPVNESIIQQAIKSQFRDFEDAVQYFCALQVPKCEAIISRDRKGFQLSTIPCMSPNEFLAREI